MYTLQVFVAAWHTWGHIDYLTPKYVTIEKTSPPAPGTARRAENYTTKLSLAS